MKQDKKSNTKKKVNSTAKPSVKKNTKTTTNTKTKSKTNTKSSTKSSTKVNVKSNTKVNTKKITEINKDTIIIPMIIVILTFVLLIVGSAYAYFTANNSIGGSTNINTEFESVGISKLASKNNLKLNVTLVDMMKKDNNINYYATLDGTPSTSENSEVIATASVEGNGKMNCNYTLEVTVNGTNNMYEAFKNMTNKSAGQLILNVDGKDYDLYNVTFPLTITGTINDLSENNSKDIKASFRIVNRKDIDQSNLANKDLTLSFNAKLFTCSLVG